VSLVFSGGFTSCRRIIHWDDGVVFVIWAWSVFSYLTPPCTYASSICEIRITKLEFLSHLLLLLEIYTISICDLHHKFGDIMVYLRVPLSLLYIISSV
jgi:hypothetical protein